jgi:histidyl-tRNA synthetase
LKAATLLRGRAVFGGGRYDNLVGDVGGDPLPGVGFAMGDVMITVLLQKYGKIDIESKREQYTVLVTVFDETLLPASFAIGNDLRNSGLRVVTYPEAAKLPKQLKFADRKGIHILPYSGAG